MRLPLKTIYKIVQKYRQEARKKKNLSDLVKGGKGLKKLSDLLSKIISGFLFFFISVLVAITFLQVLSRFVFHIPIVWSEEVVRMSFIWIIFLGSAIAVKEGIHLTLDMIVSSFGEKWRYFIRLIILGLIFIAAGIICYGGFNYVVRNIGKTAVTMQIPSNVVYVSAPISALLMMFFTIEQFINQTKEHLQKGDK